MHATRNPIDLADVIQTAEFRVRLRRFMRKSERIAVQSGLTSRRYLLLLLIKGAPDGSETSTVTELTERMQVAQHTVTGLVVRAERAGLIARERSRDDRRVVHLRLTAEGERRLTRAFRGLQAERDALQAALVGAHENELEEIG
jgi:DNA-binding MarR family transcriptional regulator